MSGCPSKKFITNGQSKNIKNSPKPGFSTSAQANKTSTGSKFNTPSSHQNVASQLSFKFPAVNAVHCVKNDTLAVFTILGRVLHAV